MLLRTSLLLAFAGLSLAVPQRGRGRGTNRGNGRGRGRNRQATETEGQTTFSTAVDGSIIMDTTVEVNGLPLRFKMSGPADQFTASSGVEGATAEPGESGSLGLNVLLHGDGGQSFLDFPNQGVRSNLAGAVILAPNDERFWGGGSGLDRTDGVAHAQAVRDLVVEVMPQMMVFNQSDIFFMGVSGGSLLLSGFIMPAHGADFTGSGQGLQGVMLNCAAMPPQVEVQDPDIFAQNTRIHFQTTSEELILLQGQDAIPGAIVAYEELARDAGLSNNEINALQTIDATPNGGHCEFDEEGFVSGVQLMSDNFDVVMQGGDGIVDGIGNVLTGVVGNENVQFA